MSNVLVAQCASRLLEASETRTVCAPVREVIGNDALDSAYAVQDIITKHRLAKGEKIVGKKIGLTSPSVQKQLGVDQPDYGMLFNTMEVMNGGMVEWHQLMQPKVEAEIAFFLKRDLPSFAMSIADVLSAIEFAVPAIEIVGSRIKDWDIRITDTIADNASASHFVIGHSPKQISELDLLGCKMELFKNGEKVSEGKGSDCLGSPINATWWLAKKMAELGTPLKSGDLILAGALGPMVGVQPSDQVSASFSGLGTVSVTFGNS